MSSNSNSGIKILVAGSSRFQQEGFVDAVLTSFNRVIQVDSIICGQQQGTDKMVRRWADINKVRCVDFDLPNHDQLELSFFEPSRKVPQELLMHDPVFVTGIRRIQSLAPSMILSLPNPEGQLGATARCLESMGKMLQLTTFNGYELYQKMMKNPIINNNPVILNQRTRFSTTVTQPTPARAPRM